MKTFTEMFTRETVLGEQNQLNKLLRKQKPTKEEEQILANDSHMPVNIRADGVYQSSVHAQARARQRRHDVTEDMWKSIIKRINAYSKKQKVRKGTFMVYDRQSGVSVVIDFGKKSIVTVYPAAHRGEVSKKQQGEGTQQMMVERFYEQPETAEWLQEAYELLGEELDGVIVI